MDRAQLHIGNFLRSPRSPALTPVVAAGILTITAALALVAWQAASSRALPAPYYKWIDEDVTYIASDQERASFNNLRTVPEAEKFIEQFWLRRAPTPGAVVKVKLEHYRRIAYSNERSTCYPTAKQKYGGRLRLRVTVQYLIGIY